MKCPKCRGDTEVENTQKFSMFVWRKRKCKQCGAFSSTHENFVEEAQRSRISKKPRVEKPKAVKPKKPRQRKSREPALIPIVPPPSARRQIEEILERWRQEEERWASEA